jgi:uncharacterized membrane protein YkvA (DUF1232 family)
MSSQAVQQTIALPSEPTLKESWFGRYSQSCKGQFASILKSIQTFRLVLTHPLIPFRAKVVAACSLTYLISPVQLIPTFIPVIGQMDDLLVIAIGMTLVRRMIPAGILEECEHQQKFTLSGGQRDEVLTRVAMEP